MTTLDFFQIILFVVLLIGLTPILGNYMNKVFNGKKHFMLPVFGWLERLTYKSTGVNPEEESNWKTYTFGLLLFNFIGLLFVFIIQLTQAYLPFNPSNLANVTW
ncbi:MAG: potassium-transporting ATPase subunit KdpA, partial [Salinivirgaceae bacterium]|nr:potassium-transporting ATPase subunit KdpA [Salinivirgaceae bacterium]